MLAEYYMELACKNLPVVNKIIREYGNHPLSAYLDTFAPVSEPSYQKKDDFLDAVFRYVSPLLGEETAKQAVSDLEAYPVILTANHLGVEYFSQSLQSSLIFSLNSFRRHISVKTVPVFSFGNIPLNNLTYPKGILLYHADHEESDNIPLKISVFPDKLKRCIASNASGFDNKMILKAEKQLAKMVYENRIPHKIADTTLDVFQKDYLSDSVINLSEYSEQCTVLNRRIWKRLFSENTSVPELIYLEIEKIVNILLEYDLSYSRSLVWHILFDPELRKHVLEALDGVKGCWELNNLEQRASNKQEYNKNCGTVFFWGIDPSGKRIPFCLTSDGKLLKGVDDNGKEWEVQFTQETIIRELKEKRLLPSLFTCFLTLSFARGIVCLGGYFQGEYLPKMQKGIINALKKSGYNEIAEFVSQVPAVGYLSGMLAIMRETEDNLLIPASTIEILAGGGINKDDLEKMLSLSVRDAHIAGLFETIPDAVPSELRLMAWKRKLAEDCYKMLKEKLVIK